MEKPKPWYSKVLTIVAVAMIVVFVVALLIVGLSNFSPQMLYPSEVRSYQGENLSSIADVKENAIKGTQYLNAATYSLAITGLVSKPLQLTYQNVINNYQSYTKVVFIYCVEGWNATILWQGALVRDLLMEAGANMSAKVVIFYASDGYSTALPMDYIVNHNILLAYKMNNLTIPPERGFPFELVAESQFGYKWIKWVTQIEVSDNANYLGYWESRGYPNNATIK
jgi:DMSO/TMAO reductase YedYZ molybdopterin-dependent catalytic subunit